MKKRSIALILLVLMICSLLAGCMKNAEAVNFAGDIDLGEDGVITKDVFRSCVTAARSLQYAEKAAR